MKSDSLYGRVGRSLGMILAGWVAAVSVPSFAGEAQWVEIKSPHFSVVTDGGEKRGRDVAVRFEQMRAVYGALLAKSNVNLPVPLQIVAFRNTKELRQFAPLWNGKPTQVAGLFLGNTDRSFILLDLSVDDPWTVVFHEYAHQLMDGNLPEHMDAWFEEGFAEYFSTIEVDGKEARVGKIPDTTYRVLQETGKLKTADLFRVQQNSSTYNESGDRRTGFYAQSAMVVHYLYDNGLVAKLATYFTLVRDQKVGIEDAIQQTFGMSAGQFDKAMRIYINEGRYKYYKLATPAGIVTTNYTVASLSAADSSAVLADVHMHSPDYGPKAMEEYAAILKTDPKNPSALRGLGYAYLLKQNFEQAGNYFQKAVEGDSKDPRVHYYAALLMSREGGMREPEKLSMMTKELETSIALDPNFADAYSLLSFAYASGGEAEKGLATMQKAVSLSPRNEMYLFNLAQMYLNNRKPDQAIELSASLQNAREPLMATRATALIAQAQEMKTALASGSNVVVSNAVHVEGNRSDGADQRAPAGKEVTVTPRAANTPAQFAKGKLVSVDCSATPAAVLIMTSGTKTLKLHVRDSKHVIVIGADAFSCAWANQKVAVNYRATGEAEGEVVSVEVQ
jgi:tetratricopeptide (TPR) repeat protein